MYLSNTIININQVPERQVWRAVVVPWHMPASRGWHHPVRWPRQRQEIASLEARSSLLLEKGWREIQIMIRKQKTCQYRKAVRKKRTVPSNKTVHLDDIILKYASVNSSPPSPQWLVNCKTSNSDLTGIDFEISDSFGFHIQKDRAIPDFLHVYTGATQNYDNNTSINSK